MVLVSVHHYSSRYSHIDFICSLQLASTAKMKTLIAFFALVALAVAYPGGHGGGGGGGGGHGGGDLATPITHGHPVVTKVFDSPGLGFFNNYAPKVVGHLDTRGIGGHIFGKGHGHH